MSVTLKSLSVRPVLVPMALPLATASGAITHAPFALVDVTTSEGVTGSAYVFAYHPFALKPLVTAIDALFPLIEGAVLAPASLHETLLKRLRLLGGTGIMGQAVSALDMAVWDAQAKHLGVPLCAALGGTDAALPAYNSKGLGIMGTDAAADQAKDLVAEGFSAIKVRLGYLSAAEDVAVVQAVREAVGSDITLMSDYNQSLTVAEAEARVRALGNSGLAWIEEPVAYDDFAGHARVRAASAVPIQTGENLWFAQDLAKAVTHGAADLYMPDAGKIGGVTGWMKAAGLADSYGLPLSSHLYPEVSAHLLAATPTAHWLEYVDWAAPLLQEPVKINQGTVTPSVGAGNGITWDEDAVTRFAA